MINKRCDRKGEGERVCEKSERERKEGERKEGERWRAGGKEEEREGGREEKRVLAHFLPITRSQKTLGIRSVSNCLHNAATMLFIAVSQ